MQTVPQPLVQRPVISDKQLAALRRFHPDKTQFQVLVQLSRHPRWPLIETNGTPRSAAAPAGEGGHVA